MLHRPNRPTGATGPTGFTGTTGLTGATGPTGTFTQVFASVFATGSQGGVSPFLVEFDSEYVSPEGIAYTLPTTTFTIEEDGVYQIFWSFNGFQRDDQSFEGFYLFRTDMLINGVSRTPLGYSASSQLAPNPTLQFYEQPLVSSRVIPLSTGDQIQIQARLEGHSSLKQINSAYIFIQKIGSSS